MSNHEKATPRPWCVRQTHGNRPFIIEDAEGVFVAEIVWDPILRELDDAKENAEDIVEAVNAYDAMRELATLLQRFYDATYGKPEAEALLCPLDFEQARAALAKVR